MQETEADLSYSFLNRPTLRMHTCSHSNPTSMAIRNAWVDIPRAYAQNVQEVSSLVTSMVARPRGKTTSKTVPRLYSIDVA